MNCLLLSTQHSTLGPLACHWQPLFPLLPLDFQHGSSQYALKWPFQFLFS